MSSACLVALTTGPLLGHVQTLRAFSLFPQFRLGLSALVFRRYTLGNARAHIALSQVRLPVAFAKEGGGCLGRVLGPARHSALEPPCGGGMGPWPDVSVSRRRGLVGLASMGLATLWIPKFVRLFRFILGHSSVNVDGFRLRWPMGQSTNDSK